MSSYFPHQLILFGPPGTSKSYLAKNVKAATLEAEGDCFVPVAFHPEFSYGEFVARLLPMTHGTRIDYTVHAGPFLRALAEAYFQISVAAEKQAANVVLLIDEINRGNCAEIFGDVFHLLDRDDDGWSSYEIHVSELVIGALKGLFAANRLEMDEYHARVVELLKSKKLRLPPNLYLLATMNTSDESIFYMDSAFKRRWNFEFCPASFADVPDFQRDAQVRATPYLSWSGFVDALNTWIVDECTAPKLDDKLVGPWFIKARRAKLLHELHAAKLRELAELAPKAAIAYEGGDHSETFDRVLLEFANAQPADIKARILDYGKYVASAPRKFTAIGSAAPSGIHYYISRKASKAPPAGTMIVEDFLDGLGKLGTAEGTHEIPRADIVGKLFLYLWDNVFDRDKTPLDEVLGVKLRTFGQFVELADKFIERLVTRTAAT
jgi:hypothetical protein